MSARAQKWFEEHRFLTGGGTETYLVFQQGFDLPEFCGFIVHEDEGAWAELERSFLAPIVQAASDAGLGLMIDALVWRAHADFIEKLGRSTDDLGSINARAISTTRASLDRLRRELGHDAESLPTLIAADIGPRGDGYRVEDAAVTPEAARDYHRAQIEAVAAARADLVCAQTMTSVAESIGIVEASKDCGLPIIISATVETDGRLPDGSPLGSFIEKVDEATQSAPLFYMVNCAHPTHLLPSLRAARSRSERWLSRFRGFRANASTKSHAELDESTELDRGDIPKLAEHMAEMRADYDLRVIGGCCGTDAEHLAAITSHSDRR